MEVNKLAYSKLMMHVLKHNSKDVVGLLIKNAKDSIIDVLPLFHETVMISSLDAAFHLIQDFYLAENPSYKVVGVYESSVSGKKSKFLASTYKILDLIKEKNLHHLVALKLNSDSENLDELECKWYEYKGDNKVEAVNTVK